MIQGTNLKTKKDGFIIKPGSVRRNSNRPRKISFHFCAVRAGDYGDNQWEIVDLIARHDQHGTSTALLVTFDWIEIGQINFAALHQCASKESGKFTSRSCLLFDGFWWTSHVI